MKMILCCRSCGRYTLKGQCPDCGKQAVTPRPPKYSTEDRYARLRRQAKRETLENEGLL